MSARESMPTTVIPALLRSGGAAPTASPPRHGGLRPALLITAPPELEASVATSAAAGAAEAAKLSAAAAVPACLLSRPASGATGGRVPRVCAPTAVRDDSLCAGSMPIAQATHTAHAGARQPGRQNTEPARVAAGAAHDGGISPGHTAKSRLKADTAVNYKKKKKTKNWTCGNF
jgi:hypothetical protein